MRPPFPLNAPPAEFPIAYSPDGRMIAVGSFADSVLYVFEAATGGLRCRFEGHRGMVRSLAFSPDGKLLASGSDDTTALLWDVSGRPATPRAAPLAAAEAEQLWADLGGADAGKAFRAIGRLAAAPGRALPLAKKDLRPVPSAAPGQVARLLRDLDGAQFETREAAAAELAGLGESAEPELRRALEAAPSPEVRRRVGQLLEALREGSPQRLRQARALELLERAETAEARALLGGLAKGAPGAALTEAARAALRRLARRHP